MIRYNKEILFGIISIILLVVFVSGCTDSGTNSTELSKSFSKDGISFKYPSNWFEMPYEKSGLGNSKILGLVGPGDDLNYALAIQKINSGNAKQLEKDTLEVFKLNYKAKIISENTTTVNGMTAFQVVYTMKDPQDPNSTDKNTDYAIQKGKSVYVLTFSATAPSNPDKYLDIVKQILSTVQIT